MTLDSRARQAAQDIHHAVEEMEMSSTKTPQRQTRFEEYRKSKSRNKRIAALVVGIAVPILLVIGTVRVLGSGGDDGAPAVQPSTPTSTPTSTATPEVTRFTLPKLTATFVSPWYGYSVSYPSNWKTTEGKGPWPSGEVLLFGDPRLDVIEGPSPGSKARFSAVSQPVKAGMTLQQFGAQNPFSCEAGARLPRHVTIDGAEAFVTLDGCQSSGDLGGRIWDVVVINNGRGYDFTIDGEIRASDAAAWLASIRLRPASAHA